MRYREKYKILPVKAKDGRTVYYVRFYDPRTGKRTKVSSGETTIGRARTFADNLLAEGTGVSPRLEDFAADFFKWGVCPWIKRQHAKGFPFGEYQAKTRRGHLENYLFPQFGKKRLAEFTRPMIEKWLISLTQEKTGKALANQTKDHILYTLRIVLTEAESENLISRNPLAEGQPLAKNHRTRDALTMDELLKLFPTDRAKLLEVWRTAEYATLFLTMASTGIRSGEARALAWRHLLPGGWLFVERAVKMGGMIGPTKTRDKRVIALPHRTQETLEMWRKESPFNELDHLIFYGMRADKPLNVKTVTDLFPETIKRLNETAIKDSLPPAIPTEGRTLVTHSLRHTYNTIMRHVLPEDVLRRFTGHKSAEMTDWYDHTVLQDRIAELEPSRALVESAWRMPEAVKPKRKVVEKGGGSSDK